MKTIGLIGGMSWESTALYYQALNRGVARRLGGLHSASILLCSLDFEQIAARQRVGDWDGMTAMLADAARRLEQAGAEVALICTNTMHKVAAPVQAQLGIPLLHIADATGGAIRAQGLQTVGLLGTRFTMEQAFYVDRLREHGIVCRVPSSEDRDEVHRIIFDELCRGVCAEPSKRALQRISAELVAQGAQGIVLGCTELPLLLGAADLPVPVFDTTELHALAALDFACQAPPRAHTADAAVAA